MKTIGLIARQLSYLSVMNGQAREHAALASAPNATVFSTRCSTRPGAGVRAALARTALVLGFGMLLAMGPASVQAHELRVLNLGIEGYAFAAGWRIEPPTPGAPNAFDFFTDVADPPGQNETFTLLDRAQGDTVDISMVPFRLKTDRVRSEDRTELTDEMIEIFPPLTDFQQCVTPDPTGLPPCEGVGYTVPFTPKKGKWGFYITGKLKKKDHDGLHFKTVFFDETYVCERGSQDRNARDKNGYPINGRQSVHTRARWCLWGLPRW